MCLDDNIKDNIKASILANRGCSLDKLRTIVKSELSREIEMSGDCDTMIISTELIHSRLTQDSEIGRLFDFLLNFAKDIEVIMFLRRQDDLAISRFSSALRAGHDVFENVFNDIGDHIYFESDPQRNTSDIDCYYDYQKFISRFLPHLPKEKIKISIYQQSGKKKNSVINDFLRLVNINDHIDISNVKNLNSAISAEAQYIISKLNRFMKPWYPNGIRHSGSKEIRNQIEREIQGEIRQVARADAEAFMKRFKESNEWVRSEFFPDRIELFHPDFSHYPDQVNYSHFEKSLSGEIKRYGSISEQLDYKNPPIKISIKKNYKRKIIWFTKFVRKHLFKIGKKTHIYNKSIIRTVKTWYRLLKITPLGSASENLPYRYALIRILGNDHPPRHDSEQTVNNLRFTLENESDFPGVKKIFIINRVYNKETENKIIEILSSHGCDYIQIPFESDSYKNMDWDLEPFGRAEYFKAPSAKPIKLEARLFAAAPKIRYAMNVNGARNMGLTEAFRIAEWALVLDGNCFLTAESFKNFERSASKYPYVPYIIMPMARLNDNEDLFSLKIRNIKNNEEPQIAIHRSARVHYDEDFPYGFRDKAELLIKLGVEGKWNSWGNPNWLPQIKSASWKDMLFKESSSTVFRLSSGMKFLDSSKDQPIRYLSRNHAILNSLAHLDELYNCKNDNVEKMIFGKIINYKENPTSLDH